MRSGRGPSRMTREFHLVVPRQAHGMHKVVDPQDAGEDEAQRVLDTALPKLSEAAGSRVSGSLGDSEPLMAIHDAINLGELRRDHHLDAAARALTLVEAGSDQQGPRPWTSGHPRTGRQQNRERRAGRGLAAGPVARTIGSAAVKLATFQAPDEGGPLAGIVEDDRVFAFAEETTVREVLAASEKPAVSDRSWPLSEVELLAPIPAPGTIYAIGLNYAAHVAETGATDTRGSDRIRQGPGFGGSAGRPGPVSGGRAPA